MRYFLLLLLAVLLLPSCNWTGLDVRNKPPVQDDRQLAEDR
jgi:hypothetical protein